MFGAPNTKSYAQGKRSLAEDPHPRIVSVKTLFTRTLMCSLRCPRFPAPSASHSQHPPLLANLCSASSVRNVCAARNDQLLRRTAAEELPGLRTEQLVEDIGSLPQQQYDWLMDDMLQIARNAMNFNNKKLPVYKEAVVLDMFVRRVQY